MIEILLDHFEYYGITPTQNQLKSWAADLAEFAPKQVHDAIQILQKQSDRTRPATPAQIIDKILGYQSPDEAWATVPKNLNDESETYVMSEEARLAWGEVIPLLKEGNIVQAFLAFKAAYLRQLEISRQHRASVKFSVSEGTDKGRRDDVLKIAYQEGKISRDAALMRNPELELPAPAKRYDGMLGSSPKPMLEAPKEPELDEETRERRKKDLQELLAKLGEKSEDAFRKG